MPDTGRSERGAVSAARTRDFARFRHEALLLKALGISKPLIACMAQRAAVTGTSIETEVLASGAIDEEAYYGGLARMAGLPFVAEIPDGMINDGPALDCQLKEPTLVRLHCNGRAPVIALVPKITHIEGLASRVKRSACLGETIVITTPSAIRRAVWKAGGERRGRVAVHGLFQATQPLSARTVVTGDQGFSAGLLISGLLMLLALAPQLLMIILHLILSLFHLGGLMLRLAVLAHTRRHGSEHETMLQSADMALPIYSVMVAIYREAAVVPQLIAALDEIDWPRSRLDIKLVCEADDLETLAAIAKVRPGPHFEVVEVPAMQPRTKPKALTYALAGARGEFITIYDAEDRPHPQQLREAYHRFRLSSDKLACLQSPLVIANGGESWLSAVFALEYAALFRRLLPALGFYRMPLPLGGTSNHFRTAALTGCGGWDPFNVTEDADLGMRLNRMGYEVATLTLPTLEDAPTRFPVWLGQRTRWYKGWLQTWLVLMRNPRRTMREMRPMPFFVFQLLIGGMLISALSHPALLSFITLSVLSMLQSPASDSSAFTKVMLAIDMVNILGSYAVFYVSGSMPMSPREKSSLGRCWLYIPVYWMAISIAAWKAVIELRLRPFYWSKTPHLPSRSLAPNARIDGQGAVFAA
nr:glycosyltransferase [uncultured Rhizobium sp.]